MGHKDVTVQIMLGGKSTRMGRDKALVELGGRTLLDRAVETWKGYGAGLQLSVGSEARRALAPAGSYAVVDRYPERGPLGVYREKGGFRSRPRRSRRRSAPPGPAGSP